MAKRKFQSMVTPTGVAVWPKINKPETKFNSDGVYETKLRFDAKVGGAFLAALNEIHDEWIEECQADKGKSVKRKELATEVEEDGVKTGELEFKFKLDAIAGKPPDTWEQRPVIYDSQGTPIEGMTQTIGSGSKLKISFEIVPYMNAMVGAGLSLRMRGVQVIDLVEFSGGGFDSMGFKQEEGFKTEVIKETSDDVFDSAADFS